MGEKEINRLTAEIHQFAFSKDWLPKDDKPIWQHWRRCGRPIASQYNDAHWMSIWEGCSNILNGLIQNRNALPFLRPVDPVRDGVPNYFEVVRRPMDLGTVKQKLAVNARRRHDVLAPQAYRHPHEFKADVDLIWDNCFLYNPPGYPVHVMGEAVKADFERRWKAMGIEHSIEAIDRKLTREKPSVGIKGRQEAGRMLSKKIDGTDGIQENKNVMKKPKTMMHDRGTVVDRSKMKMSKTNGHRSRSKTIPIKSQHRNQGRPEHQTKPKVDGVPVKGDVDRKKVKEQSGLKRPISNKSSRSKQGRIRQMLQDCRHHPTKDRPTQPMEKRKWIPPIERGADHQPAVTYKDPTESKQPSPVIKGDEWKKVVKLNDRLKRSLDTTVQKQESEMSDYEARRRLSMILETMSLKAIGRIVEIVLNNHPSLKNGVAEIDSLDIKVVRRIICQAQKATKHKEQEVDVKGEIERKESPVVEHQAKKKKTDDEGIRLATKTPMVSPPPPPWSQRLTHKREVWDNAVCLCGVTPRLEGSDVGLTPRQESNGSTWEEAIPDDLEDGEILER